MTTEEEIQLVTVVGEAIIKLTQGLLDVKAGKLDPEVVLAAANAVSDTVKATDAAIDKLAHDKFDTSESP